ncbi:MAG: PDZ domain-containing protein [Akkermansiaceae bacterium]|nr:PDZ domain-containing protein [Akkermansiaceae bacterium]NNM30219.1 PDZ domain-containing protein [Akkermansiaceae bacterium]
MVRPPQEFKAAASDYVCVRVTNINRVDLNRFAFDHDLTLALVLANADGTVYHRYGGRTTISPMSMGGLVALMKEGLVTHRDYSAAPAPPPARPPLFLQELVENRLRGTIQPVFGCYHCHYAREAGQYLALEAGEWTPDQFWIYPLPERLGLVMNQDRQNHVEKVLAGSPATAAGIRSGDVLERLGGRRVGTKYDIQWILHEHEDAPGALAFTLRRDGGTVEGAFDLPAEWKVGDPADYAWRVRNVYTQHMTKFLPAPGFTGEMLPPARREALGLPADRFALRVEKLNLGTHLAGIREGDVILGAGGRSGFATVRDFHAWCERLRRDGRDIRMTVLRHGGEMAVMVPLASLNYSKVEKAPQADLGFIVQQLPGGAGLRVGNVTDGCSAEKAGLLIGDRIAAVDGSSVTEGEALAGILNDKAPGDLLTIDVTRNGKALQFGFILSGCERSRTEVARLSDTVREPGQRLTCRVRIKLPEDKHIYSVHREGFGVPTYLEFRGRGYRLVGPVEEPVPRKVEESGLEPMWIHEGVVELTQAIEVTDPALFQLLVQVYAQVCDEQGCHEFRAVAGNDGSEKDFFEFRGHFDRQPEVTETPGGR